MTRRLKELSNEEAASRQSKPHTECPISGDLLIDPAIADGGRTYERAYILRWIEQKQLEG
jgi:hypothetical protein